MYAWLAHGNRIADRRGKVAGGHAGNADHVQGPAAREPGLVYRHGGVVRDLADEPRRRPLVLRDGRVRLCIWRVAGDSYWRGGYARGHVVVEFLRRTLF